MRRRALIAALVASPVLVGPAFAESDQPDTLGFTPDRVFVEKAVSLLKANVAVDTHAHPGRTYSRSLASDTAGAFEAKSVAEMEEGLLAAASFAVVSDAGVLRPTPVGIIVEREYAPGEAIEFYRRQIADLHRIGQELGLPLIRTPTDLDTCLGGRVPGMIVAVEGGDFLEGDASRLVKARDNDDVRVITIVHYRANELADNQTSPARYGGLSSAGISVVKEMSRLGMVVDMAHAADGAVLAALEVTGAPLLCSHTHIKTPAFEHPRFIAQDTARAIAEGGGVVGAWPSGFGGRNLKDYVDRVFALCDVVGPEHIALGTDMDGNYRPTMSSYRQLPLVVSELLRRGYGEANVVRLVGGNFRRLFTVNWRAKKA